MRAAAASRTVLVGFDSAWTDDPRNPGGLCAMEWDGDAAPRLHPPHLARFDQAEAFVSSLGRDASLLLVAIDQPTMVPNRTGSRPVDRIAASLIGRLKGGVQPACRDGFGARMFGDDAPIWRFLDRLGLQQDPERSRVATEGRFAIEVFPALALPALAPALFERRRGAKYNPAVRRHFLLEDWQLVCDGLATASAALELGPLADWARQQRAIAAPRKADQDRLDAALCLLIAAHWRLAPPDRSMVIGTPEAGHVVTPVSAETRRILEEASRRIRIGTTETLDAVPAGPVPRASRDPCSEPPAAPSPAPPAATTGPAVERVDAETLRGVLIEAAGQRTTLCYGDVATRLGFRFHQGFVASLTSALRRVSERNRADNEPELMCLVVSRSSGMPGAGFFALMRRSGDQNNRQMFEAERRRCWDHRWL